MIKNHLKIAWVNSTRNKGFAIINILGLTMGITCTLLISLWVYDEITFDNTQQNYNTIYQVVANRTFNNQVFTDYSGLFPLAKEIENYSQVKSSVVTSGDGSHVFAFGGLKLKKKGMNVSEHFFKMFSFRFLKGNPTTAIKEQGSVVLTETTSKALFGSADPINKIIRMDNSQSVKVTAVIADPPPNSSFNFEYIEPYSVSVYNKAMQDWKNSFSSVYIQTFPDAEIEKLDKVINEIIKKHLYDPISTYFTFPMKHWHLQSEFKDGINTGGMIEYVKLFSIIAIIILLIACINFMNLSTARAQKKAKEVGVRKTLGSTQKQLIFQFFGESLFLTVLAYILSVLSVYLLMPAFNTFVGKQLKLDISAPYFLIGSLFVILFTGLVSGSYPALYLSSFNPASVLKGTITTGKRALLSRRVLVTAQFIISILLISATIIVYQQIQHIKNRPIGYNIKDLVMIPSSGDINKNFSALKNELLKTGRVEAVTRTSSPITETWWNTSSPEWSGKSKNGDIIMAGIRTDFDFAKTLGLIVLDGKYFSGLPSDSGSMVLNKSAVRAMGLKTPVGIKMRYGNHIFTVIGVINDFIMESPFKPVKPLMICYDDGQSEFINIRLTRYATIHESLKSIENVFKRYNPACPFEYQFTDEEYNKKFHIEEFIGRLTNIFSGLAIFICCLGIAGLTVFTLEKRTKEIGIRKILGASLFQITSLISREFINLAIIALAITIPVTCFFMNKWLQNYDFHPGINAWVFVLVSFIIIGLTLLIVLINTVKVVNNNPVKSLRTE